MTAFPALGRLVAALVLGLGLASLAQAHHGWRWTADGQFELTGVVRSATLGNPHGVLQVDADGTMWTVEVGQPWRNERAGLTDAMFVPGAEMTLVGKRSADAREYRLKAERILIEGKAYDLYPERLP
ncbi:MAG: DUF6152 family protein [Burkholderiaceae bacterium]